LFRSASFPALPDVQPRHWRGFAFLGLALSSCGESDHPIRNGHASGPNRAAATKLSSVCSASSKLAKRATSRCPAVTAGEKAGRRLDCVVAAAGGVGVSRAQWDPRTRVDLAKQFPVVQPTGGRGFRCLCSRALAASAAVAGCHGRLTLGWVGVTASARRPLGNRGLLPQGQPPVRADELGPGSPLSGAFLCSRVEFVTGVGCTGGLKGWCGNPP